MAHEQDEQLVSREQDKLLMAHEYDNHPVALEKDGQLVDREKDEQRSEKKVPLEKPPPPRLELKAAFWVDISGFGGRRSGRRRSLEARDRA